MLTTLTIQDSKLLPVLNLFLERLSSLFNGEIKRIVLFGSYARGEQNSESDVDILLITKNKLNSTQKSLLAGIENEILIQYGVYFTVIPEYEDFFNKYSWIPFYENVEKEGILLYASE